MAALLRTSLRRALKPYWVVVLAMMAVLALAVAVRVMALTVWQSLADTQQNLYQNTFFAQGFGVLTRAPNPLAQALSAQPGVAGISLGVHSLMRLRLSSQLPWVDGRVMSLPNGQQPVLNRLSVVQGPSLFTLSLQEAIVNTAFAKAHRLSLGQNLTLLINGRLYTFKIAGIAYSPEFVYSLKPGTLAPNDKTYALVWVHAGVLDAALDMKGAFNTFSFTLSPSAHWPSVKIALDKLLHPYGGTGVYPRERQLSHQFIQQELQQLKTLAVFLPSVFMAVALFLLHLFILRVLVRQRASIALCKALGYSSRALAGPYWQCLGLGLLLSVGAGAALGQWMAQGLGRVYQQFFKFPSLFVPIYPSISLTALAITLGAASGVLLLALRQLSALPPAVAMRVASPLNYRPSVLEWLNRQWPLAGRFCFGLQTLAIARHWQRRPFRTMGTALALALGFSLLVISGFQQGAIDRMLDAHFKAQQRMDITVVFNHPIAQKPLSAWEQLPGVWALQGFRQVAGRIQHFNKEWALPVLGISAQTPFLNLPCRSARASPLAEGGVYLSAYLAQQLGVKQGGAVFLHLEEGLKPLLALRLDGLCQDYFGLTAYVARETLHNALQESPTNSGVWLNLDPKAWPQINASIQQAGIIASITERRAVIAEFEQQMQDSMGVFSRISQLFALAVALAVLVLMVHLYWEEHAVELALMNALGFYKSQLLGRCWTELAVLLLLAWPMGIGVGVVLCVLLIQNMQSDLYRVPLVIAPSLILQLYTFGVILAGLLALMLWGRIKGVHILAVLKSPE